MIHNQSAPCRTVARRRRRRGERGAPHGSRRRRQDGHARTDGEKLLGHQQSFCRTAASNGGNNNYLSGSVVQHQFNAFVSNHHRRCQQQQHRTASIRLPAKTAAVPGRPITIGTDQLTAADTDRTPASAVRPARARSLRE